MNYPDLDLVFTNDTDRWLLLRTFVGAGSLTVNLYGTPQDRRVETETAPLEVDGKVPWKRIDDPTLFKGEKVVEQFGAPPRSTSVTRRVYASDGTLMYDTTWRSYYVGEPTVVRLGTKPRPKPSRSRRRRASEGEARRDRRRPPPAEPTASRDVRLGPEDVLDEPVGHADRSVRAASTVACVVQPSPRARRRARRRTRSGTARRGSRAQRTHTVSTSSNAAARSYSRCTPVVSASIPRVADRLVAARERVRGTRRGPPRATRRTTRGARSLRVGLREADADVVARTR